MTKQEAMLKKMNPEEREEWAHVRFADYTSK